MTEERAAVLREQVRRWRERPGVELAPASAYEAVTRQMVIGVSEELREIKARLNGLLFMVAGSLLLDVALRLADRGS